VVVSMTRLNACRGTGVASAQAGTLTSMGRRLIVNNVHRERPLVLVEPLRVTMARGYVLHASVGRLTLSRLAAR
jgi:hypothetical protein